MREHESRRGITTRRSEGCPEPQARQEGFAESDHEIGDSAAGCATAVTLLMLRRSTWVRTRRYGAGLSGVNVSEITDRFPDSEVGCVGYGDERGVDPGGTDR